MAKHSPRTFEPAFALAHMFRFNPGHARRVSECGVLAVLVTGRKAKNNSAILAAIQPCLDSGLARTRVHSFTPKGCPGGRSRPAVVDVTELELTDAGLAAMEELYPAVDAWRAEVTAANRAALLAEINAGLARVEPERARRALVFGELSDAGQLATASLGQLTRVARTLA